MIVISSSSTGYNPVLACIISTSYFILHSFIIQFPFFVVDNILSLLALARPKPSPPRKTSAFGAKHNKPVWTKRLLSPSHSRRPSARTGRYTSRLSSIYRCLVTSHYHCLIRFVLCRTNQNGSNFTYFGVTSIVIVGMG
jgi:hypothetical protein